MLEIKRRDFIKGSAALAGAASVAGSPVLNTLTKAVAEPNGNGENPEVEWVNTVCQGCTTWCAVEVGVQTDPDTQVSRAVQVRGHQAFGVGEGKIDGYHGGFACPRGVLGIQELYDPDRIKTPMRRTVQAKGRGIDPKFEPISWATAIDEISDKLLELRTQGVPESLLVFRGRYTDLNDVLYARFPAVFGTPNYTSHSTICAEAEKFAWQHTFGNFGYMDYDVDHSKHVLLWGVDPTSSNRAVPAWIHTFGKKFEDPTFRCTVVDPRMSSSAAKAHRWLAPEPGTDGALALALAHQILVTGGWDKEFVGDFNTNGPFVYDTDVNPADFTELGTRGLIDWWNLELKNRDPEWAAGITGIPQVQIEALAAELVVSGRRTISWVGPGMTMHPTAAYNGFAAAALNGLLGSCDHEGGVLFSASVTGGTGGTIPAAGATYIDAIASTGSGKRRLDRDTRVEGANPGTSVPLNMPAMGSSGAGNARVTNAFADGVNDEFPYKARMAIGYWSNFAFSCMEAKRWEEALSKIYFVSLGLNACESSWFADIVLPTPHHMFESWAGIGSQMRRHAVYGIQKPSVEPLWDVRQAETEFVWMLADALEAKGWTKLKEYCKDPGFNDPVTGKTAAQFADENEFHMGVVRARVGRGSEAVWNAIVESGIRWGTHPTDYFDGGRGQRWRRAAGLLATGSQFSTLSNKFEFCNPTGRLATSLNNHRTAHSTEALGYPFGPANMDDPDSIEGLAKVLEACNYSMTAAGIRDNGRKYAFMPHWQEPYIAGDPTTYPLVFVDYKSRLNREGRSANTQWYHEFKSNDPGDESHGDVLKMHPSDVAKYGLRDGGQVRIISPATGPEGLICRVKAWEGIKPGACTKSYGQGHWAYGRHASSLFGRVPRGANNNDIIPAEYERLTASSARNAVVRVKVMPV